MDLFTAIDTRASALALREPAPSREHLQRILDAGGRAPDHGKLAPWRMVVIQGAARELLGNAMASALQLRDANATESQLERERDKVRRAPCVIAVAAHVATQPKVPEIEQVVAVGAAVQNMFLTAHALGYGAMWKTGPAAYATEVKAALGFNEQEQVIALLYLGTVASAGKARDPVLTDRVRWLSGDATPPSPVE